MLEDHFDQIAETELRYLEKALGDFDPDELDVELSQGVLTLTLGDGQRIVINSHHAAGEIWMAAFRQAWHFAPREDAGRVEWRTTKDELRTTLARLLSERFGREVRV
jgi:iron-sulfur cluster assembly protein CyaY